MKVPPPRRNPFKVIEGLEEILKQEHIEQEKKEGNYNAGKIEEEEVEVMTRSQYLKIYDDMFEKANKEDCDVMLLKLK